MGTPSLKCAYNRNEEGWKELPMTIETERNGETLVVVTSERVDGMNSQELQAELEEAILETDRVVVLDLHRLVYISSAGLRVILVITKQLQRRRARLVVCSLSDPVREIFEMSGFDKIIPVYPTAEDALTALNG